MAENRTLKIVRETKIFDPADGFSVSGPYVVTDSTVVKRGDRWWMYLAGPVSGKESIQLFSASLPPGAPLAATGWNLTPDRHDPARIDLLAGQDNSHPWDLKGGRHCPSYVKGWDPVRGDWVERIYYAGGAQDVWGPYTIGYLEWDGEKWADQAAPVFAANEDWERSSVYEPNVIYRDGKWKLWYVAGSNQENYIVQGYSESADGRSDWTPHQVFMPAEEKMFDFRVIERPQGYEAVFSRVWLGAGAAPANAGLWWCHAASPSSEIRDWSEPEQIMTAEDRGWHSGPWKPSPQYDESDPNRLFVFFDGVYAKNEPGPFPFVFTLGCLEVLHTPELNIV